MKKKLALLITASAVTSLAIAAVALSPKVLNKAVKGDGSSTMVLDGNTQVVSKDGDILYQADVKGSKFDFVGYSRGGGALGQIKQTTYGQYTYNGLIYNRSVINGLTSIKVIYGGAQLSYTFTEFLMENMDWNTFQQLDSGVTYNAPAGSGYFVIARPGTNNSGIERIEITYACQGNIDAQMVYNQNSTMGGARSLAKKTTLEYGYVELENNPTKYTNNYSRGNHVTSDHPDPWYRWNGRTFGKSKDMGTDFTIGMTIVGEYSRMTDPSKYFHNNVWVQIGADGYADSNSYAQTYIGNDNYEPLGAANALLPDAYTPYTYTGRFFGDYTEVATGVWDFGDPNTMTLWDDQNTTFRQAYEAYTLPFWFIKFHFYLSPAENDATKVVPSYDCWINGFKVAEDYQLMTPNHYDQVNRPSMYINSLHMHLVNYGVDADATPDDSYTASFTYPREIVG